MLRPLCMVGPECWCCCCCSDGIVCKCRDTREDIPQLLEGHVLWLWVCWVSVHKSRNLFGLHQSQRSEMRSGFQSQTPSHRHILSYGGYTCWHQLLGRPSKYKLLSKISQCAKPLQYLLLLKVEVIEQRDKVEIEHVC